MKEKKKLTEQSIFSPLKAKLIRFFCFILTAVLFFFDYDLQFRLLLFISVTIHLLLLSVYISWLLSRREYLIYNRIAWGFELVLSMTLYFVIPPSLMLPFLFFQLLELGLDKKPPIEPFLFLLVILPVIIGGQLMREEFFFILYTIPVGVVLYIALGMVRRKITANRQKYEYMKTLVDSKNKLLSTLTHELRTPLAVIKTSNELLVEERPGPLNETQRSLLYSSLENTKRLNGLVENILSQVKVEFSWFKMKPQPLDIRSLVRKVAADMKPYLDSKQQELNYNYPSLISRTPGDRRWLEQVLINLIHNASKNSRAGSVITIGVQQNEQCIVVSLHDRGAGIENREIPFVFNEFYQSGDRANNLNDGAGLGLTIVRDIINKHKGEVYISSQPNAGTTVSFTLPLYKGGFFAAQNINN